MAGPNATKSIFLALGANFAIAVAKGVAAFITSSGSMLAEAIHSLADCANQGLLLYGLKHSKRRPAQTTRSDMGEPSIFGRLSWP